jgi:ribosomal protein S28E/S33
MALFIFTALLGSTGSAGAATQVPAGTTPGFLNIPLLNATGPAVFSLAVTTPEPAMIYLNGNETGLMTPAVFRDLDPGMYTVSAKDENGGFTDIRSVNLTADTNISLVLKYNITVTSTPANATVFVNGIGIIRTPGVIAAEPGVVQIQVRDSAGGVSEVQNVLVANAPATLPDFVLEYDLTILSYPPGCRIQLDGRDTGIPTPYSSKVPGNIHTILVENPVNGESEFRTVNLQTGSTIAFELESFSSRSENLDDARSAAKTQTGIVIVQTQPSSGASITLNGVSVDTTLRSGDEGIAGKISLPYVIGAVKPGTATIRLQAKNTNFGYSQLQVPVISGIVTSAPFSEALVSLKKYTVTSEGFGKNDQYSINGRLAPSSAKIGTATEWPDDIRYVIIKSGPAYISYPYSSVASFGDTVLKAEPKEYTSQSVYVTSSPDGARIIVDGFVTDQYTPAQIDGLSEGAHRISVSMPGCYPSEKEVYLTGMEGSVTAVKAGVLESYPNGGLYITSDEPGAAISLYGVATGDVTPMMYYNFPVGDVKVSVKTTAGKTHTEIVTVGADVLTSVHLPVPSIN